MVRGLYTAGTGMITQMKRMDILSNNLANVETNGYKEDSLLSRSFEDMLIERINDPSIVNKTKMVGPLNTGVHIDSIYTSFEQGVAKETGNNTDLMIKGDGFFVVLTPEGERYTRDGAFEIDSLGRLVTKEGYLVLGENGAIEIGTNKFKADGNGEIWVDGEYAGGLRIVGFDVSGLRKTGSNLYENYLQNEQTVPEYSIEQGFLEGSNIDMAKSMVNMIEVYRNYESNQKVIKMIDGTLAKAVNEIGKI